MSDKPTLHEIAAMPLSKTAAAIRQHYDPKWGKQSDDEGANAYLVHIDWSYSTTEYDTYEVRADSPEEAQNKAEELWEEENGDHDNAEIDRTKVEEADA